MTEKTRKNIYRIRATISKGSPIIKEYDKYYRKIIGKAIDELAGLSKKDYSSFREVLDITENKGSIENFDSDKNSFFWVEREVKEILGEIIENNDYLTDIPNIQSMPIYVASLSHPLKLKGKSLEESQLKIGEVYKTNETD